MRASVAIAVLALLGALGCDSLPGKPDPADRYVHPAKIMDFATLYANNCTGCHGDAKQPGAAIALTDPLYLALAGDDAIRRATAEGVRGTAMPPFAQSAGGVLTDAQIEALVQGLRATYGKVDVLRGAAAPPHAAAAGDATRGADVYATYCASCHGADGRGGDKAGAVIDGSYLSLVSDQGLRTIVLAGRPALGMPDFRGYVAGRAMTADDVADVVAWLTAQRPQFAGQPYGEAK